MSGLRRAGTKLWRGRTFLPDEGSLRHSATKCLEPPTDFPQNRLKESFSPKRWRPANVLAIVPKSALQRKSLGPLQSFLSEAPNRPCEEKVLSPNKVFGETARMSPWREMLRGPTKFSPAPAENRKVSGLSKALGKGAKIRSCTDPLLRPQTRNRLLFLQGYFSSRVTSFFPSEYLEPLSSLTGSELCLRYFKTKFALRSFGIGPYVHK